VKPATALVVLLATATAGQDLGARDARSADSSASATGVPSSCALVDVASEAGLDFRHRSGISPRRHLPETMGAGLAWLDFDGDGWLDLYAVQSGAFPPASDAEAGNRLFRNLGDGRFLEMGPAAGARDRGYGQGTLAVDVEGDGDVDLVVANFGPDALWLNQGDGSFEAGLLGAEQPGAEVAWSSSIAAGDLDGDLDLDLYVARYMEYDFREELFCGDPSDGSRRYCDPNLFVGAPDSVYLQTAAAVLEERRLPLPDAGAPGRGLGVLVVDLDGDARAEAYVSNDLDPNTLWSFGDGDPTDLSLFSGAGVNREGRPEAGMGLTVVDGDGDGDPDLFVTNFDVETNTYYENLGTLSFEDGAAASGLGPVSLNTLGFGTVAADFDRDGREDLYVANGHIFPRPRRDNVAYAQPDRWFRGDGAGGFELSPCEALDGTPTVARGVAQADYDNDGDPDVAAQSNDGPLRLLRNGVTAGRWLGLVPRGAAPNTEAVGAVVRARSDGRLQTRWLIAGDSYQSSSSRRPLVSGREPAVEVEISWPSGRRRRYLAPPAERYLVLPERSRAAR
jgi:hypothetical protein